MPLDHKAIISQIDTILAMCRQLKVRSKHDDLSDIPKDEIGEVVSLLFAAIERLAPPGSSYVRNASAYERFLQGSACHAVKPLAGILSALRTDYDAGNLQSVIDLIHSDVFADFLEMADYLLQQGYKDAAAVIVGSVLEEHLRKLAQKSGIAIIQSSGAPKKADTINSELAGAAVYSKLDQKSVTAWLDLRNKAAHGNYGEYTKEQAIVALQGVRDFAARYPA
jgi:hypothetical protein